MQIKPVLAALRKHRLATVLIAMEIALACAVLAACGVEAEVEPVTTAELAAPAARPLNGCLGSVRTDALRPWQEGVAEWAAGWEEGQR